MGSLQEGSFSVGPWGGTGGNRWSFFASRGISSVTIREGHVTKVSGEQQAQNQDGKIIKSISFNDDDGFEYGPFGGNSKDFDYTDRRNMVSDIPYKYSPHFTSERTIYGNFTIPGRPASNNFVYVRLVRFGKSLKEFLKCITGTFGNVDGMMGTAITSISVVTNKNTYGPFGTPSGTPFSTFTDKTLVVGFFGRSNSQCLEALGAYLMPRYIEEDISVGPWGRPGGKAWSFKPSQQHSLNKMVIHHTQRNIQAISFGEEETLRKFGNNDPTDYETLIEINPPEYLTSMIGTFTPKRGITSLCFVTNNNTYGPFGNASGTSFSLPIEDSMVVGFHGRGENRLAALGYYVRPKPAETKIKMGPWGGEGGNKWDFISRYGINEIIIRYDGAVFAVAFRDANGIHSGVFGDGSGSPDDIIDIDWPSEYLTSISGSYGYYKDNLVVTSLSFKTNWNTYGPFGKVLGTSFSSQLDNCVIVGFYGAAGYYLDGIGFYARPFNT